MKEFIIDPSRRITGTPTDQMGYRMGQRPQICALTKIGHEFDMHTASLFMPAIGMLEACRVIDQRSGPQQLPTTICNLLASAIKDKTEKGVPVSMQRERASLQVAGEIHAEVCGRPAPMACAHECLWIECKQSDGNSPTNPTAVGLFCIKKALSGIREGRQKFLLKEAEKI